jgi:hypothetical protein
VTSNRGAELEDAYPMTDPQDTASLQPAQGGSTVMIQVANGAPVIISNVDRIFIDHNSFSGAYRYLTVYRTEQSTVKFSGYGALTLEAV